MKGTHKRIRTTGPRTRFALLLVAFLTAVSGAFVAAPGFADEGGPLYNGQAYALGFPGGVWLANAALIKGGTTIGDSGFVSTRNDLDTTFPCPNDTAGFLTAFVLCPEIKVNTNTETIDVTASAAKVDLKLGVIPEIQIVGVQGEATAGCNRLATGSTTIVSLKVGSTYVISKPTQIKPNTTINLGVLKLVLNQQIPASTNTMTVAAVHLTANVAGLVKLDTVVGYAVANVSGCQLD
jgi:hypothetical protein